MSASDVSAVELQVSASILPTITQEWKNEVHENLRFNIYGHDSHDMTKLDRVALTISDHWTEAVAKVVDERLESARCNAEVAQKIIQFATWETNWETNEGVGPESKAEHKWWESFVRAKLAKCEAVNIFSHSWWDEFYLKVIQEAFYAEEKEYERYTLYTQIRRMESVRATENANAFLVEERTRVSALRTM
jgi:hypothetical protein